MKMLFKKRSGAFFFVCCWSDHHWSMLIPCKKGGGWMDLLLLCPVFEERAPVMTLFTLHCWDSLWMLHECKNHFCPLWLSLAFCKILLYEPAHSLMSCMTSGKLYWWEHYKTLCLVLQKSLYPWKTLQFCFNNSTWEISWIPVWVCTLR